ncbi:zinc finger protein 184-like isoform X2 [Anoplophora glabripennis]|uniref:zinc finger protein 184-like isoform X2 n=1 Tax=Anoplophora glabripennis TaxID=217634 RepID=UPI00087570B8|nr:zinc finger protein 184-like isoform X2 [Anoplophora glabripennis]
MSLPGRTTRQCCAPNCKSTYYVCIESYRNKSFFKITKDRQLSWIESVRKLCKSDFTLTDVDHYFCEDHFELKCFKNSNRNSLNRNAVPTLFLGSATSSAINCDNITWESSDSVQYSTKRFVNVTLQNVQGTSCQTSISDDCSPPFKKPKYTYSKLSFPISATASTSAITENTDSKCNEAEAESSTSHIIKMTCRTCLKVMDPNSGVDLRKKLSLGKTIEEIILLFVPEMVKSKLVDNVICSQCVNTVEVFAKFIEKIVSVENYLKATNFSQKQIDKLNRTLEEPGASTTNKSLNEGKTLLLEVQQPLLKPITFTRPLRTYPGRNQIPVLILAEEPSNVLSPTIANVVQCKESPVIVSTQNLIEETKKSAENCKKVIDYATEFLKPIFHHSKSDNDVSEISSSPKGEPEATKASPEDLKTIDRVAVTEFLETKEDDLALPTINLAAENGDSSLSGDELPTEKQCLDNIFNNTDLIKPFDPSPSSTDVNLDHNRIIAMTKTNMETLDLLTKLSESNVTLIKQNSLKETGTKRILLLGAVIFHCPECKIPFTSHKTLKIHLMARHPNATPLPNVENKFCDVVTYSRFSGTMRKVCPVCERRFMTCRMLENHIRQVHQDYYLYSCQVCGKEFKKKNNYITHVKNYETYQSCKVRKCSFCKELVTKEGYKTHVETHRTFRCNKCRMLFLSARTLNKHYLVHQKPVVRKKCMKKELCIICGKMVIGSNINYHMKNHSANRDLLCDKCPKSFKMNNCLQKHIRLVHENPEYHECSLCNRRTKTKSALKYHMRLKHSDVYTFLCSLCGSGFIREDYYKRHMNQHLFDNLSEGHRAARRRNIYAKRKENDPLYTCKYCNREYTTVYKLRMHLISSHVNGMRFKCRYCDMTCKSVANRYKHEKRHEDPETFALTCQICWNRFRDKDQLAVHSLKHVASQRYKCEVCDKAFARKYLLNHHVSETHLTKEQLEEQKIILLQDGLKDYRIKKDRTPKVEET